MRRHALWHILSGNDVRTSLASAKNAVSLFSVPVHLCACLVLLGVGDHLRHSGEESFEDGQKSRRAIRHRLLSARARQQSLVAVDHGDTLETVPVGRRGRLRQVRRCTNVARLETPFSRRLLTDCSRRDPALFIERALPASNGTHDNDPPPDYSA